MWELTPHYTSVKLQSSPILRIPMLTGYLMTDLPHESIADLGNSVDITPDDCDPLYFFYDCETTGGSYYRDHIIEVAASVLVPDGLDITITQFSSLCHTSRHIARKGN